MNKIKVDKPKVKPLVEHFEAWIVFNHSSLMSHLDEFVADEVTRIFQSNWGLAFGSCLDVRFVAISASSLPGILPNIKATSMLAIVERALATFFALGC